MWRASSSMHPSIVTGSLFAETPCAIYTVDRQPDTLSGYLIVNSDSPQDEYNVAKETAGLFSTLKNPLAISPIS